MAAIDVATLLADRPNHDVIVTELMELLRQRVWHPDTSVRFKSYELTALIEPDAELCPWTAGAAGMTPRPDQVTAAGASDELQNR
ncbi:MAG: hypothetical protein ACYC3X_04535 [Pirellulaceae bacterium]